MLLAEINNKVLGMCLKPLNTKDFVGKEPNFVSKPGVHST